MHMYVHVYVYVSVAGGIPCPVIHSPLYRVYRAAMAMAVAVAVAAISYFC